MTARPFIRVAVSGVFFVLCALAASTTAARAAEEEVCKLQVENTPCGCFIVLGSCESDGQGGVNCDVECLTRKVIIIT